MLYRLVFLYFSVAHAELDMVQVLVRHGDRAPSFTYPNDDSFDVSHHFPRGFSQLTHQGFEQAKELGHFLRLRYNTFVGAFDRKQSLIRSSDKDRCIETAVGVTQTLFADQIVPVHTYSHYKHDLLLKPNSVLCRRADELVSRDKRRISKSTDRLNADLFRSLSAHTGWIVNASNIADVFNVLYRKRANHIAQPSWVDDVLPEVVELKRRFRMAQFDSDEKSRLRTGYLLGQITNDMKRRASRDAKKFVVYSTHDATLTSLMYSLGISDHQLVPYTAALMIEMHVIDGDRFVKILYRNSTTSDPAEMRLPGCTILCPFDQYLRFVSPRTVANKEEFDFVCRNHERIELPSSMTIPSDSPTSDQDNTFFSTLLTFGSLSIFDLSTFLKTKQ